MIFNILIGFVIPWIFGFFLWKKSPIIIYLICPVTATVSALFNDIGYHLGFWDFTPKIENDETLSALPLDLGLYPITACLMVYWIVKHNRHAWTKLSIIALFNTSLEFIALHYGKAEYGNGWNIGWTFVSYMLALLLVYLYYRLLEQYGFFDKTKHKLHSNKK
jgi:uncharacterized membrane protein